MLFLSLLFIFSIYQLPFRFQFHFQFRLKVAEITASRSLQQVIPREQEQQDDTLARALLTFDKARRGLDLARQRKEIEAVKGRKAFAKQKQDVDKMRSDRKQMVLRAATDGVVYHGTLARGKLGEKPSGWVKAQ